MEKSPKVTIAMYHYVRNVKNSRYPRIKGLEYNLFKEQIEFLNSKYNIIKVEELIAAYEEGYDLPDNPLLLTFDDGYLEHFTNVYPVLADLKVQGSFYIPGKTFTEHKLLDVNKIHFILLSADIQIIMNELYKELNYYRGIEWNFASNTELFEQYAVASRFDCREVVFIKRVLQTALPERLRNIITTNMFNRCVGINESIFARELYMHREQIKCMKQSGMHIGLHGYDHYWLGNLINEKILTDVEKALEAMDGLINSDSWTMNYPYGSYNEHVIEIIKDKGCKIAFTTEVKVADITVDDKYKIPRLDTNDFPPISQNYLNF